MSRPSVMKHDFSRIPTANIPRSRFDRSHGYKTTFDSGYLVPFFLDEVLPGDTFSLSANIFARLATPVVPFMDNMFMETFFFFIPNRLLWDNWQRFNGEQDNPGDSTDYLVPTVSTPENGGGWTVGSIADYFGLPTDVAGLEVSALPFRAYNLVYNEWFRDQNLQDSRPVPRGDGPDGYNENYILLRRGKRHDYFTSCLPWPQKGPGVELPLGGMAPVTLNSFSIPPTDVIPQSGGYDYPNFLTKWTLGAGQSPLDVTGPLTVYEDMAESPFVSGPRGGTDVNENVTPRGSVLRWAPGVRSTGLRTESRMMSGLTGNADLSAVSAATINSLRQAFQIQKLLERDARGGTRYTELLRSHFGVISPDARLQRPEYLGGSRTRIRVNPVQQTSETTETTPQGNLAAFGVAADSFHGFSKSFVEHGYIIGLINVRADLTYQQGIARHFSRRTRFDFYWPALAYLGEQGVLNQEIFATGVPETDKAVFGYQERWAEYRYFPSKITGKFRSTYAQPLDYWHLSQEFEALPVLNAEFIEDKPPVERVIAVQNEPQFLMDAYFRLRCARPMPVYSVPGLIDHF